MNMIEYVYMTCAGRIENIANMQIEETCGNLNVKRKLTFARNGHWTKAAGRTKATCFPSRESASVGSGDLDTLKLRCESSRSGFGFITPQGHAVF